MPTILIIGSGIAGLSAGCYAQMNGYKAQILELHDIPGGVVTSWKRNGYLIDGCIEFLNGSNPSSNWYRMWQELGAVNGPTFIEHDEYMRVRAADGRELVFYSDLDRLKNHLLKLSPKDAGVIGEFIGAVRAMAGFDPPLDVNPLAMLLELPRMMKWLNTFNRTKQQTTESFAARFQDPFLREAFSRLVPAGIPLATALGALALQTRRSMGYPLGGSINFARSVARRFCDLGGDIRYKARVVKILTELLPKGKGARAVGVRLADGREFFADWIISAADGRSTIYELLDGKFVDEEIETRYSQLPLTPSSIQISLGVNRDLTGEPHSQVDLLHQPLYFSGQEHSCFWYHHFCYDPSLTPPGKSLIVSRIRTSYAYWKSLAAEHSRYEAEKMDAAQALIQHLETRYPGIRDQVEMIDVTTPLTYERFTAVHQGSYQSFALTPQTSVYAANGMPPTLPGLHRFYQVGMWLQPGGGIFPAARSGRETVKKICAQDGKKFETNVLE